MNKKDLTIVTLIVLAAICLWWYFREECIHGSIYRNVDRSVGIFDEPAQKALRKITKLSNPNAHDHLTAGRLIDLNLHEGRINNTRDLQNTVSRYMNALQQNERDGGDDLDWFEIDQIENFERRYNGYLGQDVFYTDFVKAVNKARPLKLEKELSKIKKDNENAPKVEVIQTFVENNQEHTSDTQNVHDSAVNEQLRMSVDNLKNVTQGILPVKETFKEINEHVKSLESESRTRVAKSLENVGKGAYNATLGVKEDELLSLVWSRSLAPENKDGAQNIKSAVIDALVDITSPEGSVVCSSGRCARLVESMAVVDASGAVSGALTLQQLRNEALQDVQEILQLHIKETVQSDDSALSAVARSYNDPSVKTTEFAEKTFKEHVSARILKEMEGKYRPRMTSRDFTSLKDYILTAVTEI